MQLASLAGLRTLEIHNAHPDAPSEFSRLEGLTQLECLSLT
jgi:hypothetical protein